MRLVVHLVLPTEARLLARTRRLIAGYMEDLGVDGDAKDDIVLALDEACANVIRHAFSPGAEECFRLTAELTPEDITVLVEDDGVGFIPDSVGEADEGSVSGRGLHIIRSLMTSVEIDSDPAAHGTRLRMVKELATTTSR